MPRTRKNNKKISSSSSIKLPESSLSSSSWSTVEYTSPAYEIIAPYNFEYDDNLPDRNLPIFATDISTGTSSDGDDDIDITLWQSCVKSSIQLLQSIRPGNNISFDVNEIFTIEKQRYIVKSRHRQYFEIFPWFKYLMATKNKNFRFRESLKVGKVSSIADALKYFWNNPLQDEDYLVVEEFYQNLPSRILTPILELKRNLDKNRTNIKFHEDMTRTVAQHDRRISRMESFLEINPPMKKLRFLKEESLPLESEIAKNACRLDILEHQFPPPTFESPPSSISSIHSFDISMLPNPICSLEEIESTIFTFPISNYVTDFNIKPEVHPASIESTCIPLTQRVDILINKTTQILKLINLTRSREHSNGDENIPYLDLHSIDHQLSSVLLTLQDSLKPISS